MTDINCVFENFPWKIDGKTRYTCVINECHEEFFCFKDEPQNNQKFDYEKLKIVNEITNLRLKGEHKKENLLFLSIPIINSSHVIGLFFTSCRLLQVPSKFIASNFNNLKALSIKSSKLREISRDDLKPLVNLEVISLNDNHLTYLPADLFVDLKNLKSLSFRQNKIKLIGLEIFDHLSQLKFVDLSRNDNYDVIMSSAYPHGESFVIDLSELREIFKSKIFEHVNELMKVKASLDELKVELETSENERNDLERKCIELSESNETLVQSHQISIISLEEAELKLNEQKRLLEEMKNSNKRIKVTESCGISENGSQNYDPTCSHQSFTNSSLCLQLFNKLTSNEIDSAICKSFIDNSSIFNDIIKHLSSDEFRDLTIGIGCEEFKVHKYILAARSPVFGEMMRENFGAENLSLENIPVEIFRTILKFIYGEQVEVNERNSKEIFMAAGTLKMKELQCHAGNFLVDFLDPSNALEMLKLANKYNHDELRQKAFEEIQIFFNDKPLKAELAFDCEKVLKLIEAKKKIDEMMKNLEEEMEN